MRTFTHTEVHSSMLHPASPIPVLIGNSHKTQFFHNIVFKCLIKSQQLKGLTQKGSYFCHLGRMSAAGLFAYLKTGLEALSNDPKNTIDKNQFHNLYCALLPNCCIDAHQTLKEKV